MCKVRRKMLAADKFGRRCNTYTFATPSKWLVQQHWRERCEKPVELVFLKWTCSTTLQQGRIVCSPMVLSTLVGVKFMFIVGEVGCARCKSCLDNLCVAISPAPLVVFS